MPTKGRGEAAGRPRPRLAAAKAGIAAGRTGGVAADAELAPVSLRIPRGVLARVDRLVAARRAENPIPRPTWLLDAVNPNTSAKPPVRGANLSYASAAWSSLGGNKPDQGCRKVAGEHAQQQLGRINR